MVREWSEFGSKFGCEFELEWGPVDFLIMVVVSESEIILSSSEVKRILVGDLSREGGLSKDLFWVFFLSQGFFH